MAYIHIKDAQVERLFHNDKGLAVAETFKKRDGTDGKAFFTVWLDEPGGYKAGDHLNIGGVVSARAREYDDKDGNTVLAADISVNNATIEYASDQENADDAPF